jgi:hypothetical protein
MNHSVFVGTIRYPIDTLTQIQEARRAMRKLYMRSTPVYCGDKPTGSVLRVDSGAYWAVEKR